MISPWQIWIDTGGTFTDCLGIDPHGNLHRLKILSNSALRGNIRSQPSSNSIEVAIQWPIQQDVFKNFTLRVLDTKTLLRKIKKIHFESSVIEFDPSLPEDVSGLTIEISSDEEVPVLAARLLTATPLNKPFPPMEMKLGSTRGTNAILERKGARTAFVVTKGFKDLLLIGNQQRPDLFTLNIQKVKPLYEVVIEVEERISADGKVIAALTGKECARIAKIVKQQKIESVAIALLNSYRNPAHEQQLAHHLAKANVTFVSCSHQLSGQLKILPRAETTVANAYLSPVIHTYSKRIQSGLKHAQLKIMSSGGSLLDANDFHPKDSLLSGPAGGIVGAATTARLSGIDKIITFDMGGTSTDVALYNQRYDYRYESQVGDLKILSPSLAIDTIAAGGGSICDFDGYRFTVGPHSAGAFPGPACYGAGGPLTITDVNLLLGRIDPDHFAMPVHVDKARFALNQLLLRVNQLSATKISAEEVLDAFVRIANEKMADAIRRISIQQGHHPVDFTLLSFGGAGGQHACSLAALLGMKKVLIPYDAGLLSAYGIGHADVERFEEQLVLITLDNALKKLPGLLQHLWKRGRKKLLHEGYPSQAIQLKKQLLFLRFKGQESTIEIEYEEGYNVLSLFRKKYESIYGHWLNDREVELESVKIIAAIPGHRTGAAYAQADNYFPQSKRTIAMWMNGKQQSGLVHRWEELRAGAQIKGPALIVSKNSTTVVEKGWSFLLDENNNALLQKGKNPAQTTHSFSEQAQLELFTNRFTSVAQEMGVLLQRTSFSVNVKERLDFSCAVLDANGYLVVNAPHIPVHLGSLGVCVREVRKVIKMEEGDVVVTNHPAFGGSHLPDVTLIKPVFYKHQLIGYVANRAHHAEIGGKKPGSMPVDAVSLEEEGVILSPTYLIKKGSARWNELRSLFENAKYPTRLPEENMADLNGALAAVNLGEKLLQEMCLAFTSDEIARYMKKLREHAHLLLSQKLKQLRAPVWKAEERLDDGSKIKVRINRNGSKLKIDFTGTSGVHYGNLNATPAIVQSVVLYVLRLWVNQSVPMNEGLMKEVKLILPRGFLNPDFSNTDALPAVVGGNTEVSQRLTDTLLKAVKLAACSQGTMNNFLFGNSKLGYYETICGGVGAGNGFDGADAVHQHMTNTRITDPEVLELRYPVRLVRFEIRKNSGGKGKWKGGNGIIREIILLEDLDINLLSQHRVEKPYGLKGGSTGKTGKQVILHPDGKKKLLKGMDGVKVNAGDRLVIETPGGGGYGKMKKPRL